MSEQIARPRAVRENLPRAYRESLPARPRAVRESIYVREEFAVSDAALIAVMREYDAFFWCEAGHLAVRRCYGEPLPPELRSFCRRWKSRLLLIASKR